MTHEHLWGKMNSRSFSVGNDCAKENADILPKDAQGTDLSLNSSLPRCLIWRKFLKHPGPQFPWDDSLPLKLLKAGNAKLGTHQGSSKCSFLSCLWNTSVGYFQKCGGQLPRCAKRQSGSVDVWRSPSVPPHILVISIQNQAQPTGCLEAAVVLLTAPLPRLPAVLFLSSFLAPC